MNSAFERLRKGDVLNGRASGALLLLAWTAGIAVTYAVIVFLIVCGLYNNTSDVIWLGLTGCTLGLYMWQAVLLLPSWWRRLCWLLVFFLVSLPASNPFNKPVWYDPVSMTAAFQALLLTGVRQRVWVWMLVAIATHVIHLSSWQFLVSAYSSAYTEVARFIPRNYILSFPDFYTVIATLAFGAAAYFMPLVTWQVEEERHASRVDG
jgi:hypothetical protein